MIEHGLSIRQPWADLILRYGKDVENRTWPPPARLLKGDRRLWIASSAGLTYTDLDDARRLAERIAPPDSPVVEFLYRRCEAWARARSDAAARALPQMRLGLLLGYVTVTGCTRESTSPWAATGQYQWLLADPVELDVPREFRGRLGVWTIEVDRCEAGLRDRERGEQAGILPSRLRTHRQPLDAWFDEHDADGHDLWTVPTQSSKLAHYAMWPARLAERLILSMCPAEVCAECGEPRARLEVPTPEHAAIAGRDMFGKRSKADRQRSGRNHAGAQHRATASSTTLGWSTCGCGGGTPTTWRKAEVPRLDHAGNPIVDDAGCSVMRTVRVVDDLGTVGPDQTWIAGSVLDPFCGAGTTLAVADLHRRDAIGIDIDDRNRDLYLARRAEVAKVIAPRRPPKRTKPGAGALSLFEEAG